MILKLIDSISIITYVTIALDSVDFNHIRFQRGLLSWNAAFPRDPHLFLFKLIGIKNNISTLRALSGMILIFLLFNISIKVHTTKPSTRAPQFCCSDMFFISLDCIITWDVYTSSIDIKCAATIECVVHLKKPSTHCRVA